MTLHSTSYPSSVFENGKLKPGIYKIQNIQSETFLDVEVHTREVCCRPTKDLGEGRGFELWGWIYGTGDHQIQVEHGKPEQFCTPVEKLGDSPLVVTPYPVAWRVEVVEDDKHRGFEYVRFFWGNTNWAWSLAHGSKDDGAKVWSWIDSERLPRRIWKLIPVKVENVSKPSLSLSENLGSGSLPSYDWDAIGPSTTHAQHVESEHDEPGTTVNEVTVVTTTSTVTTRKKYRVGDS